MTCPNEDVVYGLGFFSLDEEPVAIQLPDFGDRFWVYALYDARTNQFGQVGTPYGTKPGFYLLAGPNWKGSVPTGITEVVRSATELANAIPRVFQDDTPEDRKAIQPVINQIVATDRTKRSTCIPTSTATASSSRAATATPSPSPPGRNRRCRDSGQ